MVLGGFARSGLLSVLAVTAGYLGLVACVSRALVLWNIDAFLFEDSPVVPVETSRARPPVRPRHSYGGRSGTFRLLGLAGIALAAAISAPEQRTTFQGPNAAVHERSPAAGLSIAELSPGEG